jgi:hypothetical protein
MQSESEAERPTLQDVELPHIVDTRATATTSSMEGARRADAIKRLEKKRGWMSGFVGYLVVNAFLIAIWAMTGRDYFWPAWVLGGWGLGMVLSFWDVYLRRPITDADIEAELRRR